MLHDSSGVVTNQAGARTLADNTTNNEEADRVAEAVMFVSNYYNSKDDTTNLAANDIEITITNLVVMTHFLFQAITKLIDIEMAKGSSITSVNKDLDELDNVLRRCTPN
jgi:hypothetical protein